jgi:hypothetical protein
MSAVTIKMSLEMCHAMNDCLAGETSKKRNVLRNHAHLMKALRAGCTKSSRSKSKRADGTEQEFENREWHLDGGTVEITRPEALDYLVDILNDKIEAGIPAQFSIGYVDLDDALAAHNDEYKPDKSEEEK